MFLNIVCNNKNSQKFHENWKTPKPKKAGKWKSSISIETFCENGKIDHEKLDHEKLPQVWRKSSINKEKKIACVWDSYRNM